ncbi:MAG: dimethylarginine dimethylaminohydrolase family protein [Cetobacterium sp.]
MFKNTIVRKPSKTICKGITSSPELGQPNYELALKQHLSYINALKSCGVNVIELEALDEFPDSCFVEDTAVLTKKCAIISNPGVQSRNKEIEYIVNTIEQFYPKNKIEYIEFPGTLDGGDVMMVGDHFYIGKSERTNKEGINQFISILNKYGLSGSEVTLDKVLHLKTGINYIENNNILVSGEFIEKKEFQNFNKIIIQDDEAYAANCIWINDSVIIPFGYPQIEKAILDLGYKTIIVDTSEFKKIDGGLSCLSLRF